MEMNQKLEIIKQLLPHLHNYHSGKKVNFGQEDKQALITVYQDIYNTRINTGCPSCIINALEFLEAYYSRESGRIIEQQVQNQLTQEQLAQEEPVVLDKKKPCKKCGKNKSK